jgi:hypothetical protein
MMGGAMLGSGGRVAGTLALAAVATALTGCDGETGSIAAKLGAIGTRESGVAAKVAAASRGIQRGEIPNTTELVDGKTQIAAAKSDIADILARSDLTTDQRTQAQSASAQIDSTQTQLESEQSIVSTASTVEQGAQHDSITERFLRRAGRQLCKRIRKAQLHDASPEATATEEEAEVTEELGSEAAPSVVQQIVSHGRELADRGAAAINNVVAGNRAGQEAILQAAFANLSCPQP